MLVIDPDKRANIDEIAECVDALKNSSTSPPTNDHSTSIGNASNSQKMLTGKGTYTTSRTTAKSSQTPRQIKRNICKCDQCEN